MLYRTVLCESSVHFAQARTLMIKYADWLDVDLCFQNFSKELEELEKVYSPRNRALLLLVLCNEKAIGVGGLKMLSDKSCEMKRVYVDEAYRGLGIGRHMVERLIQSATLLGYETMFLSTLPKMKEAIHLYYSLGMGVSSPYGTNPFEETIYMSLSLNSSDQTGQVESNMLQQSLSAILG